MTSEPLALSIVEHYAYCPRQAALIHVEGVWAANADTALGEAQHATVDRAVRSETRGGVVTWLSLPVWSDTLGMAGICDAVEITDGSPKPIEYKPKLSKRRLGPAAQQLAAQAMCLEEMWSTTVMVGVLFTQADRRRHDVAISPELREATRRTVIACGELMQSGRLPVPVADARCRRCSVSEACGVYLPDLSADVPFAQQPEGDW